MISNKVDLAQAHMQEAIYKLINSETSSSQVNNDIKDIICKKTGEDLQAYTDALGVLNWFEPFLQFINPISVGLGVLAGTMSFIPGPLSIIAGAAAGLSSAVEGGLQIAEGSINMDIASKDCVVKKDNAQTSYLQGKADDISNKTKDTYQALSNMSKTFNQLISMMGHAAQNKRG